MSRRVAVASEQPSSGTYHQKMTWKITQEDWNSDEDLCLEFGTKIPGTCDEVVKGGGRIYLLRGNERAIVFQSYWPKEVKENVKVETIFRLKKGSEVCFVLKDLAYTLTSLSHRKCNLMMKDTMTMNNTTTLPNPTELDLYDDNKAFFIEAEILIVKKNPEVFDSINAPCKFLEDMKSILKLEDISDLKIVCRGEVFKCHKTILCARSTVFKKMLSGETFENLNRVVTIEDASAEAVKEMLKYIYTGEIPDKLDVVELDLLHLATKYLLDTLKLACGESIVSNLDNSNCISSFQLHHH
eukprot:GFUD01024905.1.p1 GENE.GFUD01024905.1~~GFUD01024905.1.p1  ORF type:complete len:298 (+),score=60.61 GFUD01024905.1:42-935(+)